MWPVVGGIRGWHAAFWIVIALAGVFLAIHSDLSVAQRLEAAAPLAALALAYATLVQPARRPGWRSVLYLLVAVAVTGITASVDANLSMLLFIVYPQIWMLNDRLRAGIAFSAATFVSSMLGFLTAEGFAWRTLREYGPQMAVALLFSLLLGTWIGRVVEQSMERAALIEELRATRSQLSEAEHARGVMTERERLAREIHDTLAQGFTSVVMLSQAAAAGLAKDPARTVDHLGQIEEVARENLAEARALVAAFSPVGLQDSTLPDAVRRLADRFGSRTGITVDLDIAEAATTLSRDQEVVLLRAVQESLANVRRHAGARRVLVRLLVGDGGGKVQVCDDGAGFHPVQNSAGYGLAGMRGRVEEVGGEMDVASAPGEGTRVTVRVPAPATGRPGGPGEDRS